MVVFEDENQNLDTKPLRRFLLTGKVRPLTLPQVTLQVLLHTHTGGKRGSFEATGTGALKNNRGGRFFPNSPAESAATSEEVDRLTAVLMCHSSTLISIEGLLHQQMEYFGWFLLKFPRTHNLRTESLLNKTVYVNLRVQNVFFKNLIQVEKCHLVFWIYHINIKS